MKTSTLFFFIFIFIFPFALKAQWVNDPSINTFVCGSNNERAYPLIVADSAGNSYITNWEAVSDTNVNYNFWLQRLNAQGNRMWGNEGIRISAHPTRSWLSSYDLKLDNKGNSVIAFEDMRSSDNLSHVYVYAVDPEGNPVYDSAGVKVDSGNYMCYSPVLAVTTKGNTYVSWNCSATGANLTQWIRVQKLSRQGHILWNQPLTIINNDSTFLFPNILPLSDDGFILLWERRYSSGIGRGRQYFSYIYAQRFDSSGQSVWPQKVAICDHGDSASCMPVFFLIQFARDANEGAYVSWFDDRYLTKYYNIYVQHIDVNGNLKWLQNGVAVSPENDGYNRTEPQLAYDPFLNRISVFWGEMRPVGSYASNGLVGQSISSSGLLNWGDLGKTFMGFSQRYTYYATSAQPTPTHGSVFQSIQQFDSIVGQDTAYFSQILVSKVDSSGVPVWSPSSIPIAATWGVKDYTKMSALTMNMYIDAWEENRDDPFKSNGSIYAQNINLNGKLGPMGIVNNVIPAKTVTLYPNPSGNLSLLSFSKDLKGQTHIRILNEFAQEVMALDLSLENASNSVQLDASKLPSGIYFVEVTCSEQVEVLKWIVSRD